ncbi:hypothetical protein QPK87_34625 [Kamptonema cortianum]|nr:hypothetical protein [Kamptonema cortianum]
MPEIVVLGLVMILGLGAYWSMVIFHASENSRNDSVMCSHWQPATK